MMRCGHRIAAALLACGAAPAAAEWTAATPAVAEAAKDARIAAVLAAVDALDRAVVVDDHAAFDANMADDLIVNNPQNRMSPRTATAESYRIGRISYARYDRMIEHASVRSGAVLLMGEERVSPKPPNPLAGKAVVRRFTDLWKRENGRWRLSARQATIISSAP